MWTLNNLHFLLSNNKTPRDPSAMVDFYESRENCQYSLAEKTACEFKSILEVPSHDQCDSDSVEDGILIEFGNELDKEISTRALPALADDFLNHKNEVLNYAQVPVSTSLADSSLDLPQLDGWLESKDSINHKNEVLNYAQVPVSTSLADSSLDLPQLDGWLEGKDSKDHKIEIFLKQLAKCKPAFEFGLQIDFRNRGVVDKYLTKLYAWFDDLRVPNDYDRYRDMAIKWTKAKEHRHIMLRILTHFGSVHARNWNLINLNKFNRAIFEGNELEDFNLAQFMSLITSFSGWTATLVLLYRLASTVITNTKEVTQRIKKVFTYVEKGASLFDVKDDLTKVYIVVKRYVQSLKDKILSTFNIAKGYVRSFYSSIVGIIAFPLVIEWIRSHIPALVKLVIDKVMEYCGVIKLYAINLIYDQAVNPPSTDDIEVSGDLEGVTEKLIDVLPLIISFIGYNVAGKDIKPYLMDLPKITSIAKSYEYIASNFGKIWNHIMELITGVPIATTETEKKIDALSDKLESMQHVLNSGDSTVFLTPEFEENERSVQIEKESIRNAVAHGKIRPCYTGRFNQLETRVLAFNAEYKNKLLAKRKRPVPVWIYLHGPRGTGKSTLMDTLKPNIWNYVKKFSNILPDNFEYSSAQVFSLNESEEFYDGYQGQFFVVIDDLFQIKDRKVRENIGSSLIRMCTPAAYQLKVANMTAKSVTQFTSSCIITTTNVGQDGDARLSGKNIGIESPAALENRRTICVYVDHNGLYMNGEPITVKKLIELAGECIIHKYNEMSDEPKIFDLERYTERIALPRTYLNYSQEDLEQAHQTSDICHAILKETVSKGKEKIEDIDLEGLTNEEVVLKLKEIMKVDLPEYKRRYNLNIDFLKTAMMNTRDYILPVFPERIVKLIENFDYQRQLAILLQLAKDASVWSLSLGQQAQDFAAIAKLKIGDFISKAVDYKFTCLTALGVSLALFAGYKLIIIMMPSTSFNTYNNLEYNSDYKRNSNRTDSPKLRNITRANPDPIAYNKMSRSMARGDQDNSDFKRQNREYDPRLRPVTKAKPGTIAYNKVSTALEIGQGTQFKKASLNVKENVRTTNTAEGYGVDVADAGMSIGKNASAIYVRHAKIEQDWEDVKDCDPISGSWSLFVGPKHVLLPLHVVIKYLLPTEKSYITFGSGFNTTVLYDEKNVLHRFAGDIILYYVPEVIAVRNILGRFQSTPALHKKVSHILLNPARTGVMVQTASRVLNELHYVGTDSAYPIVQTDLAFEGIESGPGYCGSFYLSHQDGRIMALHSGGNRNHDCTFAAMITREMIEPYMEKAEPQPITREPVSQRQGIFLEGLNVIGTLETKSFLPAKSKITRSRFSMDGLPFRESTDEPAMLKQTEDVSPLKNALAKFGDQESVPFTQKTDFTGFLPHNFDYKALKVLTLEEAIYGVPGYVSAIDMTTSLGRSFKNFPGGRRGLFFNDLGERRIHPTFMKEYNEALRVLEEGKVYPTLYESCLKDELRPIDRVKAGKTRLFDSGDLVSMIIQKRYLGTFFVEMTKNPVRSPVGLALNPHGDDWRDLHAYLTCGDETRQVIAGDFSSFDMSLKNFLIDRFIELINNAHNDHRIEKRIRQVVLANFYGEHALMNFCYLRPWGTSSGSYITSMFNTFSNWYIHKLAFENIYPKEDFSRIKCTFTGDDSVLTVPKDLNEYNMAYLQKYFKEKLRMVYTTCNKNDDFSSVSWEELTYLKRNFVFTEEGMMAPLKEESISNIAKWSSGYEDLEVMTSKAQAILLESFHHGRERFNKTKSWVLEQRNRFNLPFDPWTYEQVSEMRRPGGKFANEN